MFTDADAGFVSEGDADWVSDSFFLLQPFIDNENTRTTTSVRNHTPFFIYLSFQISALACFTIIRMRLSYNDQWPLSMRIVLFLQTFIGLTLSFLLGTMGTPLSNFS
jgi:hypothetical protein